MVTITIIKRTEDVSPQKKRLLKIKKKVQDQFKKYDTRNGEQL